MKTWLDGVTGRAGYLVQLSSQVDNSPDQLCSEIVKAVTVSSSAYRTESPLSVGFLPFERNPCGPSVAGMREIKRHPTWSNDVRIAERPAARTLSLKNRLEMALVFGRFVAGTWPHGESQAEGRAQHRAVGEPSFD